MADHEVLHLLVADGRDDEPIGRALPHQLRGDARGCGGHEDAVVRRLGRISDGSITRDNAHVLVAELGEKSARAIRERQMPLDGDDIARELREHRRLVPRARADLEHVMRRLNLE